MSSRLQVASLSLAGLVVGAAVVACTAGDDFLPAYGVANGLAGKTPSQNSTTTDGGTNAGGCVAGETPALYVDAGTCAVSFSKDIEAYMSNPLLWDCSNTSCHGSGVQQPQITGTASVDYPVLAKYSMNFARPYINPCSTDPSGSSITCNVTTTGNSCDNMTPMPETTGGNNPPTAAQLTALTTWLQCGAPNN